MMKNETSTELETVHNAEEDRPETNVSPETRDSGSALPLVAMMLTVLIGLSAFAIDLGWFYLNATRVQRAADAAALAGVVHMPYDFTQAEIDALELAGANGYVVGGGTSVTVTPVTDQPNMLQVEVQDTVDTFFLKVFGKNEQVISRKARAEFVPPLPLGSPNNSFGNSCDPALAGCTNQPNFWANIHGKYTSRSMGDAYSSLCTSGSGNGCTQGNSPGSGGIWRDRGYLYGIEVPSGNFSVNFTDMNFHNISGGVGTNDNFRTGDRGCEDWGDNSADCGQTIITTLYEPDPDPLVLDGATEICSVEWPPQPQVAAGTPYVTQTPACMSNLTAQAGIYVLQVQVKNPASQSDSGLNRYGLSVSGAAGSRLYALGDMSIYNNFTGSVSDFYLAEVGSGYRGKTFVIELFDPGEGNGFMQVMAPNGAGSWNIFNGDCTVSTRPTGVMTGGWNVQGSPNPCQVQANNSGCATNPFCYQDRWVKVEIELPADYDCDATNNCWWKVNYAYSGGVTDTTTWRAYIIGNPIHLVPSGP
jgi:hypothetical protein